jgi:hypothetical protein
MLEQYAPEFDADTWHEYFANKFLPKREIEMPDMTTRIVRCETRNLPMHPDPENPDAPNWATYTMEVEVYCAERGVYLES